MKQLFIFFALFYTYNAFAQVSQFKIIYGNKELVFNNGDTLSADIFKYDSVELIPDLQNPMNKYSFEGGRIIIKSLKVKEGKMDTIYYFDNYEPIINNRIKK